VLSVEVAQSHAFRSDGLCKSGHHSSCGKALKGTTCWLIICR
jgi:hypothetical protein